MGPTSSGGGGGGGGVGSGQICVMNGPKFYQPMGLLSPKSGLECSSTVVCSRPIFVHTSI